MDKAKAARFNVTTTPRKGLKHWSNKMNKDELNIAMRTERDQLAAQVEQLRQLSAELLNECEGLGRSAAIWKAKGLAFGNIHYQDAAENLAACINNTPAQCLAEIKAQAVEDALSYAESMAHSYLDIEYYVDEYIEKLRQQAKGATK